MNKIESFKVDHTKLKRGIYISRVDGNIITYDIRTREPNTGNLMSNSTMHSFEHMMATFLRNSTIKNDIIYFGPMGCQTGFYLITKDTSNKELIETLVDCLNKITQHEGEVFGSSEIECGNFSNLDLTKAKDEAENLLTIMKNNYYAVGLYP